MIERHYLSEMTGNNPTCQNGFVCFSLSANLILKGVVGRFEDDDMLKMCVFL